MNVYVKYLGTEPVDLLLEAGRLHRVKPGDAVAVTEKQAEELLAVYPQEITDAEGKPCLRDGRPLPAGSSPLPHPKAGLPVRGTSEGKPLWQKAKAAPKPKDTAKAE